MCRGGDEIATPPKESVRQTSHAKKKTPKSHNGMQLQPPPVPIPHLVTYYVRNEDTPQVLVPTRLFKYFDKVGICEKTSRLFPSRQAALKWIRQHPEIREPFVKPQCTEVQHTPLSPLSRVFLPKKKLTHYKP